MQTVIKTLAAPKAALEIDTFGKEERGITIYYADQSPPVAVMQEINAEENLLILESPPSEDEVLSNFPKPAKISEPLFSAELSQEKSKCLAVMLDLQCQAMLAELSRKGEMEEYIPAAIVPTQALDDGLALFASRDETPGWLISGFLDGILPSENLPQPDRDAALNELAREGFIVKVEEGWKLPEHIANWANHAYVYDECALLTLQHDVAEWDTREECLFCARNNEVELVLTRKQNGLIGFNKCTIEELHERLKALVRQNPAFLLE
jgi:hypothetical protein